MSIEEKNTKMFKEGKSRLDMHEMSLAFLDYFR